MAELSIVTRVLDTDGLHYAYDVAGPTEEGHKVLPVSRGPVHSRTPWKLAEELWKLGFVFLAFSGSARAALQRDLRMQIASGLPSVVRARATRLNWQTNKRESHYFQATQTVSSHYRCCVRPRLEQALEQVRLPVRQWLSYPSPGMSPTDWMLDVIVLFDRYVPLSDLIRLRRRCEALRSRHGYLWGWYEPQGHQPGCVRSPHEPKIEELMPPPAEDSHCG